MLAGIGLIFLILSALFGGVGMIIASLIATCLLLIAEIYLLVMDYRLYQTVFGFGLGRFLLAVIGIPLIIYAAVLMGVILVKLVH